MPAALSDPIPPQEEEVLAQILGLLRALGRADAPRACEVGACVGLTTCEAEKALQVMRSAGMVDSFLMGGQLRWGSLL